MMGPGETAEAAPKGKKYYNSQAKGSDPDGTLEKPQRGTEGEIFGTIVRERISQVKRRRCTKRSCAFFYC